MSLRSSKDPAQCPELALALVGVGGAVGTTVAAGLELLRRGRIDETGLPLAGCPREDLVPYSCITVGGWDLRDVDLGESAAADRVMSPELLDYLADYLHKIVPWPGVRHERFTAAVDGDHVKLHQSYRAQVAAVREDLRRFRDESGAGRVVVVNLASTERAFHDALDTEDELEEALDQSDSSLTPTLIYAYASVQERIPFCDFTPSSCLEHSAIIQLAERLEVPIMGRDGKTGQTLMKTAIAPALRSRDLRVIGWYSMNLLGNRDGLALTDPGAMSAKVATKSAALESILGYEVGCHVVRIEYYPPLGDNKQAIDVIDFLGFLGAPMQLQMTLQARDSILAAPLVIEIARLLDLAFRRGCSGVQEEMGFFFKDPMVRPGGSVEHDLFRQEARLIQWLNSL